MLLFDLAEGALRFLVPVYLQQRGYSLAQVGVATSAFGIATLASRIPAGLLYRPSRARVLILGAGAASASAFACAPFVDNLAVFSLLMALDGIGWGIVTTALFTLMMSSKPEAIPASSAMGWYVGFQGIGHALASGTGGVLGDALGLRSTFLMLAIVPFAAAALICLRLPGSAVVQPATPAAVTKTSWRGLRRARLLPAAVWVAALAAVYLNVMNSMLNTFFPLLGLSLGLSLAQVGSLASLRSGMSAVARFAAIPVLRRVPTRRLWTPLLVASAATTAAVALSASYLAQLPIWALNGISRGFLRVSTGTDAMETLTPGEEGLAAGFMSAGLDLGKIVGPLLGGVVAQAIGMAEMFIVMPMAFLALFVVFDVVSRRSTPRVARA